MQHEKTKYCIGLDAHKKKTTHVARDRLVIILLEGEAATLLQAVQVQNHPCF